MFGWKSFFLLVGINNIICFCILQSALKFLFLLPQLHQQIYHIFFKKSTWMFKYLYCLVLKKQVSLTIFMGLLLLSVKILFKKKLPPVLCFDPEGIHTDPEFTISEYDIHTLNKNEYSRWVPVRFFHVLWFNIWYL